MYGTPSRLRCLRTCCQVGFRAGCVSRSIFVLSAPPLQPEGTPTAFRRCGDERVLIAWTRLPAIQIIDGHGGSLVRRHEAEDDAIEEQLGFEAPDNRVRLAESVLFALESEERDGQTLRPYGVGHHP